MTLKLLERRLNNNFEPYKGEDGQIFRGEHSCMMSMSRFVRHIKAHKGMGEISLFGGVAIGHKTLKGVQLPWVYAWPFPKRLFRGKCNSQDFVFVRPRGSDHTLFLPSPDNVWYCRCLLIFTIVVRTDVMGSVRIKCAGAVLCSRSRGGRLDEEG
jgi:hypothetical protein